MEANFFKAKTYFIMGKGVATSSEYLGALTKNGFSISQDNVHFYLQKDGKVYHKSLNCKDGWKIFIESIPKHLLTIKQLKKATK